MNNKKEKKTEVIQLRTTKNEKEFIKQKALVHSYTNISEFILSRTIYPEKFNKKRMLDICYEVNKVGVNLNQLVRLCNKNRTVDLQILQEIKKTNALLENILREY